MNERTIADLEGALAIYHERAEKAERKHENQRQAILFAERMREKAKGERDAARAEEIKRLREVVDLKEQVERLNKSLDHWKDCHGVAADALEQAEADLAREKELAETNRLGWLSAAKQVHKLRAALKCDGTTSGQHVWKASALDGMHDGWCGQCEMKAQDIVDRLIAALEDR